MEKLRIDLDQTEQDCEIINRREKLLNFRQTKFTAVGNLKSDMTPFISLWAIASSFTKTYECNFKYNKQYSLVIWHIC